MSRITILDTDYATLWYYPESKIVRHVFHRFIYGKEFRQLLNTGLEVMKANNAHKWLSDDRKNSALPTDDQVWSIEDWVPRCLEAGWKQWAIVMPDKPVGQAVMNRLMKPIIDQGLNIQVFDDPEIALQWLESTP